MAKYISSISDFVIQAMTTGSVMENKAKGNDPEACFQMGMIHLLGIDKPVSFRMAISFFDRDVLKDNSDAARLLGFIAECEGNYSQSFKYFSKASEIDNDSTRDSYLQSVAKERKKLIEYFNKLVLPKSVVNEEISTILNNNKKSKKQYVETCSKIATLCNDEPTCLEAAQAIYNEGDFFSALMWLKKGKVEAENSLYKSIEMKMTQLANDLIDSQTINIIELEGDSLLPKFDPDVLYAEVKKTCDAIASESQKQWKEKTLKIVDPIIRKQKDEEYKLALLEEEEEDKKRRKRKRLIVLAIMCGLWFVFGLLMERKEPYGFADLCASLTLALLCYWPYHYYSKKKEKEEQKKRKKQSRRNRK